MEIGCSLSAIFFGHAIPLSSYNNTL